METIQPINRQDLEAVDRFLAGSPAENVHLLHLLHTPAAAHELVGVKRGDEWVAVAGRSGAISVYAETPEAVEPLAMEIASWLMMTPYLSGREDLIEALWGTLELLPFPVRYDRRQEVYTWADGAPEVPAGARLARAEELEPVAALLAAVMREEVDLDPFARAPEAFRASVAESLDAGRVVVVEAGGELAFQLVIENRSPHAAELTSCYTPPAFRRRGYGRTGLAAGCRWGLDVAPRLVFVVFEDNLASQGMAKGVGFTDTGLRLRALSWDLEG